MLKVGEIIKGPFWPEIVEIKNCEQIDDDLYLVESIGRSTNKYFDRYLEQYQLEQLEKIHQEDSNFNPDRLQHYLQYYILKTDERYSQSRARGNKKIIPLPHQIEAVYSRMLQSPQVRYLLADDPGAGKTIMSGMLIRELLARQSAERILILVPPLVLKQWQEELKDKFGEDFTIVTRSLLNNSNEINPFEAYDKVISSVYWASREEIKSLILKTQFDLVIVDEAHKMAAYTHGVKKKKIQRTKMYQLGEALLRHTEHCLLLTATPHKGDKENFRHLMSLVDHDIFSRLNSGESMYEKSNPFVIRRLKESMVNFNGTPLFPKRTTKTISFELSLEEQELYEEVTEYVREHFNRAKQNNKPNVAFAMMILQRRLSSSLDAIYLSLLRRKERLEAVLYNQQQFQQVDSEDFEDLSEDEQEELEMQLEGETETLNLEELQLEIDVLGRLVEKANWIRQQDVERKYIELEQTLFGKNGLLAKEEKILIFTESKDTLYYLEKKLLAHVPEIAKIVGNFSMDQRRSEVEKFRNELQIMLATDAGGESINLQFCNQMINYDIPWNPNRLEQRMGRIHRIGQKNEVFIFNLVASNTREGDVLVRLLEKMEQMRNDLGQELVYDFIGDVLKEQGVDLSDLMEQAISGRENLDELIARMEKTLSEEHKRLLELAKQERMDEESFDLPGMRRAYQEISINSLPSRVYSEFVVTQFEETRIRLHLSSDETIGRIDRFPKNIRELAKKRGIPLNSDESIRFTLSTRKETEETPLLQNDHPLYKLALELASTEVQQVAIPACRVKANVNERVTVELDQVSIVDGTGRELERSLMLLGKRESGEWIQIDPFCLFTEPFEVIDTNGIEKDTSFKREAIMQARRLLQGVQMKRDDYVNKKSVYLRKSFEEQMTTLQNRFFQYEQNNFDNKNSALINQTYTQIEDLEERSRERLDDIERERSIQLQPIKRIAQLVLEPTIQTGRVIPEDVFQKVKEYEYQNGRLNIQKRNAFGLIDFTSEGQKEEIRFIIVTESLSSLLEEFPYDDYIGIEPFVYIYVVKNGEIQEEIQLEKTYKLL
ncbi:DEAD/DEAH box helicase [Bacillus sp. ISL-47]|uniref:DEAD/DEAH box helicase n=1 Tax=Bacillus sp. ISL-47 TaxID=2819130 RepID=UPI001BE9CCF0|nr:helicase-related protein [Bacillus sp. ISL-47]MBT2687284.1 DEAD/DEAH box helicase [Bacillus sp. ISL-47]MBT2706646.1 DEAD/DEAH box helicase [Pseudomonas sp. ISL-84]